MENGGACGHPRWSTAEGGYRINDGEYSYRNPANSFAWSASRLGRVTDALAP